MYYGFQMNMRKDEILECPWGQFMDFLNCRAIENGAKPKKRALTYEEAIALR
jgi:hypothetical protein